jgi:hypothetical protein
MFIHPLTSFIKPSSLGDKIGQKLVDLHKGTIIVPKARHCFMYRRTLDTIQTGDTNHFQDPGMIKLILLIALLTMMTGVCQMKFSYIWIPCGDPTKLIGSPMITITNRNVIIQTIT